jgi:hypothetical protein
MFYHDTQEKRRINAAQLYAVGQAYGNKGQDLKVDGARWFVMAKSPRLAVREVVSQCAKEIAQASCNAVRETVKDLNGRWSVSGVGAEDLGDRILYVIPAEELAGFLTLRRDHDGTIPREDKAGMEAHVQLEPGVVTNLTFRFARVW